MKETSIGMDDQNLDEIHVDYPNNKVEYILHPNIYVFKILSWMIEIWMKIQLISDSRLQLCKFILMLIFIYKE
jgi:hypothetical protein